MRGQITDGDGRVQVATYPSGAVHAVSVATSEDFAKNFRRTMERQGLTVREMSANQRIQEVQAARTGTPSTPWERPDPTPAPDPAPEARHGPEVSGAAPPAMIGLFDL